MTPLVTRVRSTGVSGITKRTQRPALIRTRANIGDIARSLTTDWSNAMNRTSFIALLVGVLGGLAPRLLSQGRPVTPADQAAGQAWWAQVKTLADDSMEGRLTGSEGYLRAAKYVVSQFDTMGLQPAGVNGYYQPVKFDVTRVIADKSSVSLLIAGRKEPLELGHDAILGARGTQPESITAPLVFIGYGLHLPEVKYDDFDSPDVPFSSLKGKIVVYINGGPGDLSGALKSFARTSPLAKALADAGAVGSITIPTPKSMDFPWDRVAANASQPGMRLAADPKDAAVAARHPALADIHRTMFSATFNPGEAEKLFAGTGHTFAELLALADAQKPLPRFDLKKSLTASVTTENTGVESPNIVAKLEGSDPALKREYILLSAHLDHLGVGKSVFAGAMDDASGVASVLEIARSFSQNRDRPKRSMLFVIFTGEEKGLLGSRYFAAHSIEIATDPEPDRNSFTRTDQYSFVQAGVPALAMKFGWTKDSPEYKAWRQWLATRYHSTEDNLSQPVDTAAAAQFNSFLGDLARRVANSANRPHYVESSFFHRFEK
jgi:hypothetical protein